ncbi:MAG: alpha/beta hydrolase [Chiayiivirga sp.]|jgi:hypothetical protein|nr:alpha/beta hydrolase [Chiayiivirga sp.]
MDLHQFLSDLAHIWVPRSFDVLWPPLLAWMELAGYLAVAASVLVLMRGVATPVLEWLFSKKLVAISTPLVHGAPNVIVIHGTWGRWSAWFTEARLYAEIAARFAPHPVNISRFYWSGFNALKARFDAADKLAEKMRELQETNPGPIVLLAHSHGGNVATLACKKLQYSGRTGLVAVSTPFLYYRYRELGTATNALLAFSAAIAAAVGVFLGLIEAMQALQAQGLLLQWDADAMIENALVATLGIAAFFTVVIPLSTAVFLRESHLVLQTGLAGPTKTRVIRAPYDEASGVLSAARGLVSLLRMPVRLCHGIRDACKRLRASWTQPLAVGTTLFALVGAVTSISTQGELLPAIVSMPVIWLYGLTALGLGILATLLLLPGAVLGAIVLLGLPCILSAAIIVSLAYGVEVFSLCLRLDVGVEASPHGEAVIQQIERVEFRRITLDHSAILSDGQARKEVVSTLWTLAQNL